MARHAYTTFSAEVSGKLYTFKCWATPGRHYCTDQDGRTTRYTFGNRPWESFTYDTVLSQAIRKFPDAVKTALEREILKKTATESAEAAEREFQAFKALHEGLSPENKKLMKSYPELQSEDDVRACMGFMSLLKIMQK